MKIYQGDALSVLETFHDETVDCVVTSPPYFALRDYGVEGQIGLEGYFGDYLVHLIQVFDEIKRVLKKTGTCWVNLGDTYGGSGKGYGGRTDPKFGEGRPRTLAPSNTRNKAAGNVERHEEEKSLLQVPARFALAMTDRGWILRNKIIWHKPNAMPSSAKDRFTVDYEEVLFFVKSRRYYFDQVSVKEPVVQERSQREMLFPSGPARGEQPHTSVALQTEKNHRKARKYDDTDNGSNGSKMRHHTGNSLNTPDGKRIKRAVWSVSTTPYKSAHFATFPEKLVETPIIAGCPKGGYVLDPFMGSGTTLAVAEREGRHGIGIEINPAYIKLAADRIRAAVRIPNPKARKRV